MVSRAKGRASASTVQFNFSDTSAILSCAEAVHGAPLRLDEFDLARVALKKLGLMRKSRARTRRPTVEEIQRLIEFFAASPRQYIPMDRIIPFAIATAMRDGEIFRIEWADVDMRKRLIEIGARKAPQDQDYNDQVIPMLNATGFDAWQLVTRGDGLLLARCAGQSLGRGKPDGKRRPRDHPLRRAGCLAF